jgi:hypothetical protein
MSSGFRFSCYWTDWNWANTENIRIGLVFAVLAQWKFLYYIDRFDHIKSNKETLNIPTEPLKIMVPVRYHTRGKQFLSFLSLTFPENETGNISYKDQ